MEDREANYRIIGFFITLNPWLILPLSVFRYTVIRQVKGFKRIVYIGYWDDLL